ncbi:MAG: FTR1 family protein [Bacteroidetes bacterium]|nr:FTR1 family protein [Bacteroidota bacterium]
MKKFPLVFSLLILSVWLYAVNPESARILVHTLNYLGTDYKNAVDGNKVVDEEEYEEMLEFCEDAEKYFNDYARGWKQEDSIAVGKMIQEIVQAVEQKQPAEAVAEKCSVAKLKIIAATGLKTYPSSFPNIENGLRIFKTECAKCHGEQGYGDGLEGLELSPKPRNFHDDGRMQSISAAHIFNTVRLGVEGTGMRAIPYLEDEEVWDVAFYVLSIRHTNSGDSGALNTENVSLEQLSVWSDKELQQQFSFSNEQIARLRHSIPEVTKDKFLKVASSCFSKALSLYKQQQYREASDMVSLAYLEGIEPIELQLNSTDPALKKDLEMQIQHLRKLIRDKAGQEEYETATNEIQQTITKTSQLLEQKEYSFWMALLMTISIMLREGLEAFLVILVILAVLRSAKVNGAERMVHLGWLLAVFTGIILWFLAGKIISTNLQHMALMEAIVSFLAVLMLLYVGFWLHGKSEIDKWKQYVNGLVNGAVKNGSMLGLMALSFFVVFREVFESVLFLSALNIESGGTHTQTIALGVVVAFMVVLLIALVVIRFSAKIPLPALFKISSFVMAALAVVLAGKGVHSLQETGMLDVHALPIMRIEMLGIYPTIETCMAQLTVAVIAFLVWKRGSTK